ncbi:universal stress protein [Tsukamurella paurometabola]|uniref:Universal stress protein n=1 Tax=Tsukamurella paurometabola TaxID=2061 RepID=A0A3P8KL28_TSUPA|nr:universal stress protein [Tsukamurella paurometabola]MBS4102292.1 universal stress protein [Tsukamurella paurometabola]UEA84196.1 universal stress protein [Tsukamurella paurometabola]VDR41368.1 Universal stress protein family [Tsukamurella paurometabola]
MTILVAHSTTPESAAALEAAYAESERRNNEEILVFILDGDEPDVSAATARGLTVGFRHPKELDRDPVGGLVDVGTELDASVLVIGIKHRTATGKLLFGSAAQRILLDATCPVLAVKAAQGSAGTR